MDKSYFKTRKAEIQSEIDSWKQEMRDLEDEYGNEEKDMS